MTGEEPKIADGRYTAVVDRFEDPDPADGDPQQAPTDGDREGNRELAVLLLESDESVAAERAVPSWRLPEDARRQDAVLELVVRNGFVTSFEFDREATEQRTTEAQARFDSLAERPGEEGDDAS